MLPGSEGTDLRTSSVRYGHSESSWKMMWKKVFSEAYGPQFAEESLELSAHLVKDGSFGGGDIPLWDSIDMMVWSVKIL